MDWKPRPWPSFYIANYSQDVAAPSFSQPTVPARIAGLLACYTHRSERLPPAPVASWGTSLQYPPYPPLLPVASSRSSRLRVRRRNEFPWILSLATCASRIRCQLAIYYSSTRISHRLDPLSVVGKGWDAASLLLLLLCDWEAVLLACAESYGFLGIAIVAPPPKFTIESRHSWHSQIFNALLKNQ